MMSHTLPSAQDRLRSAAGQDSTRHSDLAADKTAFEIQIVPSFSFYQQI